MNIRPMTPEDMGAVLDLSIRAWEPVFQSFEQVLGKGIFHIIYPDWQPMQRDAVRVTCENSAHTAFVADVDGVVAGFVVCQPDIKENGQDGIGEVHMLAVDPRFQRQGIGTALNQWAIQWLREAGMKVAVVGTGGDPGHAPARAAYEKAGYTPLPIVRYYQEL